MIARIALPALALTLAWGMWHSAGVTGIAAGVAIFLLGMLSLEDGFKTFTGGTLQRILRHSTDRMWKSLLFGFSATTLMQSSSLVSVISISFLSAGLLGLAQGIGIIYGANLGSTTGAWLVAGFGLKVDLATWAMPILIFGVLGQFGGDKTVKGLGRVLTGLGLLFLGIHYMKEGFETFGQNIDLAAYAVPGLAGLLLFTVIGMVATVLMQSSHATLVLIITALAAGQITYENALALSIGANVGTTITALIGALGANIQGRRLAAAHLVFNVGTGVVALAFIQPFVLAVEHGSALLGIAPDNHTLKLALFHTLFNLAGILLMLPLTGTLVHMLERILTRGPASVVAPRFINANMFDMPQAALEAARRELQHLFNNVFDVMALALHTDPVRMRRGEGLELLDQPPGRVRAIDIDDYYARRIKPLYGEILDFLAHTRSEPAQAGQMLALRRGGQHLVEALKDLKHMQKNLERFLAAEDPYPKNQYLALRRNLAILLHALHALSVQEETTPDTDATLVALRARVESWNAANDSTLERLLRERRLSTADASSLVNDNAYARSIAMNLLDMAGVLFKPLPPSSPSSATEEAAEALDGGAADSTSHID